MKKLLFLLFLPLWMVAQSSTGQETPFDYGIKIETGAIQTVTNPVYPATMGTDGTIGRSLAKDLPIDISPQPTNYTIPDTKLGSHLKGIDVRLGQIGNTTAGITSRIYFTAVPTTITAGTFYTSSATGKGAVTGVLQTVSNDDNVKNYFGQDVISIAQPSATTAPPGNYSGQLSVMVDSNSAQERFTIEIYKTDNNGTPIASGITGAPVGNLGVTVVAILDSGVTDLVASSVSNVSVSGNLASTLSLAVGERLRYHVSAQKVGTSGNAFMFSLFYGSDYNSYYDVTVTPKASTVVNDSGVVGGTVAEALNYLSANKEDISNKATDFTTLNNTLYPSVQAVKKELDRLSYPSYDNFPSDIMAVIGYGQSLSLGATADQITFGVIDPNFLKFQNPYDASGTLEPFFIEPGFPEVPYAGMVSAMSEIIFNRDGAYNSSKFLFSWAGVGGATINDLSIGTTPYDNLLTHVLNGKTQANLLGKSYSVVAIPWTQGEADNGFLTPEEYRTRLLKLRDDLNADIKAITGQKNDINFIMYQLSSFNADGSIYGYNRDFATVYQYMDTYDEGFFMGNPCYDKVYNDVVHLNSISYKRMGAEYGIILDKIVTNEKYERLKIVSYAFQGKFLNLIFNKTVVADDLNVSFISGFGFLMEGNPILDVELNNNRITIEFTNDLDFGDELTYAFNSTAQAGKTTGPRGNIRSVDVNSFTFANTYDWLAHTKIILSPLGIAKPLFPLEVGTAILPTHAATKELVDTKADTDNVVALNRNDIKKGRLEIFTEDSDTPVLGSSSDYKMFIGNGFSSPSYGVGFAVDNDGNTIIQSQRTDGLSNTYQIKLNPLGGTVTALTAAPGTNTTQIATTAFVQGVARPYKVYTSLLQLNDPPTVTTMFENSIGAISWTKTGTGIYHGTLSGAFPVNKVFAIATTFPAGSPELISVQRLDSDTVILRVTSSMTSVIQDSSSAINLDLRVYN